MQNKSKAMKPCLSYKISVEGENCEVMYFNHLQELINNCGSSKYKVHFDIKKKESNFFCKKQNKCIS